MRGKLEHVSMQNVDSVAKEVVKHVKRMRCGNFVYGKQMICGRARMLEGHKCVCGRKDRSIGGNKISRRGS